MENKVEFPKWIYPPDGKAGVIVNDAAEMQQPQYKGWSEVPVKVEKK